MPPLKTNKHVVSSRERLILIFISVPASQLGVACHSTRSTVICMPVDAQVFQRAGPLAGIHATSDLFLVDFLIQLIIAEVVSLAATDGAAHTIGVLSSCGPHVETGVAELVVIQALHGLLQHLVAAHTHTHTHTCNK